MVEAGLPVRARYSTQCTYRGATRRLGGREATELRRTVDGSAAPGLAGGRGR
jgi:hypothetical protein